MGVAMSSLRVIGAGLGRTGTYSLKLGLERLLNAPCYHMFEVFDHPEHIGVWEAATGGALPDWEHIFAGYRATVDWPAVAFWPDLLDAYPDAVVVLSVRPTEAWWRSASRTIFELLDGFASARQEDRPRHPVVAAQRRMAGDLLRARFTPDLTDQRAVCEAYERHNEAVRRQVPADRLVEWTPGDGWEKICAALDLPVPAEPFPRTNSTDDFRAATRLPPLATA